MAKKVDVPLNKKNFVSIIKKQTKNGLIELGCREWDGEGLLLFPHSFYDIIPDGFPIVTIGGGKEKFKKGKTDDDQRFGCLPYGIVKK